MKLYLLLYADDTVIFAESQEELQLALNAMCAYCDIWKLKVNSAKTKVVIFSKGKSKNTPIFHYNDALLEVVEDFSYLGVKFNYNGKFCKTKKHLCDQARRAMFALLKKSRGLKLSITCNCIYLTPWSLQFYYIALKCGVVKIQILLTSSS